MNGNWLLCSWPWFTFWTILISEFTRDWWCFTKTLDDSVMSLLLQPGFDWHATRNWWPADGMGSRSDKMSPGHGTPVTKLLPRSWHQRAPCLTFSAETRMGAWWLLTVCGGSVVSIPDLHRILGKTGTNQQSNTNDINITDKWIQ